MASFSTGSRAPSLAIRASSKREPSMNSEWGPCLRPLRRELALPAAVWGVSIMFSLEKFGVKTRSPHLVGLGVLKLVEEL